MAMTTVLEAGGEGTRSALSELRLERLRVWAGGNPRASPPPPRLPPGLLSPAHSPDEASIQLRGRKRLPVTWSPDADAGRDATFRCSVRTPPRDDSPASPRARGAALRPTPRKRLWLTPEKIDFGDISTPQKFKITSPAKPSSPAESPGLEPAAATADEPDGPLEAALRALSPARLARVVANVARDRPEVRRALRSLESEPEPEPELAPLDERLGRLRRAALAPVAPAERARRAAAFRACVGEQARALLAARAWRAALQYSRLAWRQARGPHAAGCLPLLARLCVAALRRGGGAVPRGEVAAARRDLCDMSRQHEAARAALRLADELLAASPAE